MRIRFTPSHDGETWPSVLGDREAAFGEASYGPLGLLGHLESCTGLTSPRPSRAERIARWLPALRRQDAFYSASLETDPVGTARVLLRWRDELALQGWKGEVKKGRLADLAAVDQQVADGLGDRLRAVQDRLAKIPTKIEVLELSEVEADLPHEWLQTIAILRDAGAEIRELAFDTPPRGAEYQLFRPEGPRIAADEVAAWLASSGRDRSAVIIGGDAILDLALRRHGLPTTGAAEAAPGHGFQLLALCMHTAFWPADPKQVQEFLSLRPNPLPEAMCRRLLPVLAENPGIGNPAWNAAVEDALLQIEEPQRRGVQERLRVLFPRPELAADPIPEVEASTLLARLDLLDHWIRSESELDLEEHARVSSELRAILAHGADRPWDRLRLSRWLTEIASNCRRPALFSPEAGLVRVDTPAAVMGPVSRALWWSFLRSPDDREGDVPWTEAERGALRAAGIPWPSAAQRAQRRAAHWQRPVMHAAQLLLVAPLHGEDGEESHPHPLYDELISKNGSKKGHETRQLKFQSKTPEQLPLPLGQRQFQLNHGSMVARDAESANSLEKLISCPFAYAMQYQKRLRPGMLRPLATGNRLMGSFAHALFADLLDPERAAATEAESARGKTLSAELSARFHQLAPLMLAELYQAGGSLELRRQEQVLVRAYEQVRPLLARAGLKVVACEKDFEREEARVPCGKLAGRLDMVLGPELAVLDLKSGKSSYLSDALEEGRSIQLAVYSRLLLSDGEAKDVTKAWPKAGYYLLGESRSLSTESFLSDTAIRGADPRRSFFAACKSARRSWRSLSSDSLALATGIDEEGQAIDFSTIKKSDGLAQGITQDESLHLNPSCGFCDFSGLCGHALEAAQS